MDNINIIATKDQIGDALDYEIGDWRETQRAALQNIKWPKINSDSNLFKTAAMFNFGFDASNTLFPTLIAANIAGPILVIGKVQAEFQKMYQNAISQANVKLSNRFTVLRDSFIRQIQNNCRNFKDSPYARNVANIIHDATKDIQFKDDRQRDTRLRQLIRDANLIETDPQRIRKRTNDGFQQLCVAIRDLWKASYHDPWFKDAQMWFSSSTQLGLYPGPSGGGRVSQQWKPVHLKKDQDWIICNAWRMKVVYKKTPGLNDKDNCWVTLINKNGTPTKLAKTFTGTQINSASLTKAITKLKQSL